MPENCRADLAKNFWGNLWSPMGLLVCLRILKFEKKFFTKFAYFDHHYGLTFCVIEAVAKISMYAWWTCKSKYQAPFTANGRAALSEAKSWRGTRTL